MNRITLAAGAAAAALLIQSASAQPMPMPGMNHGAMAPMPAIYGGEADKPRRHDDKRHALASIGRKYGRAWSSCCQCRRYTQCQKRSLIPKAHLSPLARATRIRRREDEIPTNHRSVNARSRLPWHSPSMAAIPRLRETEKSHHRGIGV